MSRPAARGALGGGGELPVGDPLAELREAARRSRAAPLWRRARAGRRRAAPPASAANIRRRARGGSRRTRRSGTGSRRPAATKASNSANSGSSRPRGAGAQERGEAVLQRDALDAPHRLVVDRRQLGDGGEPLAERARRRRDHSSSTGRPSSAQRVDQDRIEEAPVGGMIGARPAAVAAETACAWG